MADIKVYTVEDVAKILKVQNRTIRDYIRSGKLKALKLGRAYRVKEEDLKAFLSGNS
jgi:excisionase family DNA binding protein